MPHTYIKLKLYSVYYLHFCIWLQEPHVSLGENKSYADYAVQRYVYYL